jgi:hypothetical protein
MVFAKALVAVLMAALISFQSLATDGVSVQDWASIAVAVLTAVGVYVIPNVRSSLSWAKTVVAMLLAGAQAAVQVTTEGGITGAGWLTIAIAAIGVVSVYAVPNKDEAPPPLAGA